MKKFITKQKNENLWGGTMAHPKKALRFEPCQNGIKTCGPILRCKDLQF
jgi:hypothetical protein